MGIKTAFKKTMLNFIEWVVGDEDEAATIDSNQSIGRVTRKPHPMLASIGNNFDDNGDGLTLTVYSATGGKIIRVSWYDRKTDRTNSALHIITQDEDLGEELAQIITRESLTR